MSEIVVAGGGAAGMMAAIAAARRGAPPVLVERNQKVGRKLYITGKGRCNVTNHCSPEEVRAAVPHNGKFLYSALEHTPPAWVEDFFESLGVPLKVERGSRVFPVSDRSSDVIDALFRELKRLRVPILRDRVTGLRLAGGAVSAVELESGGVLPCKAAVLATGGLSYPATGSTGDGHRMAGELGHTIADIKPSLVPLESPDAFCARMQGLALKNVRLTVKDQKKKTVYQEQGELLFTHFGLSGPLALSASAHMRDFGRGSYTCAIDLKPALDESTLDARLVRELAAGANKDMDNLLGALAPRLLVPVLLERAGVPGAKKGHDLTRQERRRLLELFKDFSLTVSGPRPIEEAIVTSGGVKVSEVDPRTMRSKKVPGLFFAGELLDVDAYTGGFNLQIAWATGRAAGEGAAAYLRGPDIYGNGAESMSHKSVAIDGPAGAGKSTLARRLARELGFLYVDTGAIYRTVALKVLREKADPAGPGQVVPLLERLEIHMGYDPGGEQKMYLEGEDVSGAIRRHEVSGAASKVSAIPEVRAFLLDYQRKQARENNVVMDGRDIGTVVLPGADVKIFLTASPEARARRRLLELEQRGEPAGFDAILRDIKERDYQDEHRPIAPLRQAADAVLLDTTELNLEQSLSRLLALVKEKIGP